MAFLKERGYNPEETGADFMMFQALTTDPSTPPAGPTSNPGKSESASWTTMEAAEVLLTGAMLPRQ